MTHTITVRMSLRTYKSFRRSFKAKYNETAADYFKRLAEYLCEVEEELEGLLK